MDSVLDSIMGGTTEFAGNFVPRDECVVSFFDSRAREAAFHMGSTVQEDILQQLEILHREAEAALAEANSSETTQAWHSEYLGRKGSLTGILRNLGTLAPEERPLVGKVANEIKVALEQALQERQAADRKSTRLNSSHANISYAVF